ncbi:MAG: Hsp20/alpha crystallin family protein [Chloroflexota bacterium]|nr:MAG: Hsp20/alpha crystallin family protein [Chloroflexota bacterium]
MVQQWNPFRETIDQFLHEASGRPSLPPARLTADVYETTDGEAFVVEIAVPGVKPDEIKVEAAGDSLTVSTQPQQAEPETGRRYFRREHPAGPMSRIIDFPEEIDTDNTQATLEHGILKIHVPKAAVSRSKVIKVRYSA